MVLWQCDLRVSRRARLVSLLLHGMVMLTLLLARWPVNSGLAGMLLLTLLLLEAIRSQRRILYHRGNIALLAGHQLRWHHARWYLAGRPWLTRQAILLSLRSEQGQHRRLWLFADAMEAGEWRLLRQQLLMHQGYEER